MWGTDWRREDCNGENGGERRTCGVSNNRFLAALDAELAELSQQSLATCVHGAIDC